MFKNESTAAERHYSTTGRPRALTDTQIAEILAWHRAKLTNAQMARRYGIARGTLEHIVRNAGQHYKQASPEFRPRALIQQRTRRRELFARHWL